MARKAKKGETAGCLFLLLLIGGIYYAFKAVGWPVALGAGFVGLFILGSLFGEKNCGVCGGPIARTARKWTVNGKKVKACASCSRRLQNKASKEAVDRLTS
jgi:hypothetical protein